MVNKNILRQPKIYNPPKEENKEGLPKYVKIIILFLIFFFFFIYLIFLSPLFKIKKIEIFGTLNDNAKELLEKNKGHNIFLLNSEEIIKKIKDKNSEIDTMKISLGIPSTLRVKVEEKDANLVWETNGSSFLVDSRGNAYQKAGQELGEIPKVVDLKNVEVEVSDQIVTENFTNFIKELNLKFSEDKEIDHFEINETVFQVTAVLKNGIKVIFDTTRPLSDQIEAFDKVYFDNENKIKEYIDVRVEGWVYYK